MTKDIRTLTIEDAVKAEFVYKYLYRHNGLKYTASHGAPDIRDYYYNNIEKYWVVRAKSETALKKALEAFQTFETY